jgi:hypothetical protein
MSLTLDSLLQTLFEVSTLINSAKRIKVSNQLSLDWSLKQSVNIHTTKKATCSSFQGASSSFQSANSVKYWNMPIKNKKLLTKYITRIRWFMQPKRCVVSNLPQSCVAVTEISLRFGNCSVVHFCINSLTSRQLIEITLQMLHISNINLLV